jgi:hypothetical protein
MDKLFLLLNGLISGYTILCTLGTAYALRRVGNKGLLDACHGYLVLNLLIFMSILSRIADHFRGWPTGYLTAFATLVNLTALYIIIRAYKSFSTIPPK